MEAEPTISFEHRPFQIFVPVLGYEWLAEMYKMLQFDHLGP